MDERKLDTAGVIASGITSLPIPETDVPDDREWWSYSGETEQEVRERLERGVVVEASNYYGIPHVWKADEGHYRCLLLQYRAVTDDQTFAAIDDAIKWFIDMYARTDG